MLICVSNYFEQCNVVVVIVVVRMEL